MSVELDLKSMLGGKPPNCPACGRPIPKGFTFMDPTCWSMVPGKDRSEFSRQYRGNERRPAAWKFKADKIIRIVKEKLEAKKAAQTSVAATAP